MTCVEFNPEKEHSNKSQSSSCRVLRETVEELGEDDPAFSVSFDHISSSNQKIANASFTVDITVIRRPHCVVLQFPAVNFQITDLSGGYLKSSRRIESEISPFAAQTITVATNDGMGSGFSFVQSPSTLPDPVNGFTVIINPNGALKIQAIGTTAGLIPKGAHTLFPFSATFSLTNQIPSLGNGETKATQHTMTFQVFDPNGFPVGSSFTASVKATKTDSLVSLQIPSLSFTTGPLSSVFPFFSFNQAQGGFLFTVGGELSPDLSPSHLMPPSVITSDGNYVVSVRNTGQISVSATGQFQNDIPPGDILVPATNITYVVDSKVAISKTVALSTGRTDVTQFTISASINNSLRDLHVGDAYKGEAVFVWNANDTVPDKTNNTLNVMFAKGRVGSNGKLEADPQVQLTNLPPNVTTEFSNSVCINRTDPKNIIVAYSLTDRRYTLCVTTNATYCRAVSFDGGETWGVPFDGFTNTPTNGRLTLGPPYQKPCGSDINDNPGVKCDVYGNILYLLTLRDALGFTDGTPVIAASFDKGLTFQVVYTGPPYPAGIATDTPSMTFGKTPSGQYGVYLAETNFDAVTSDYYPRVSFIPINGFGATNIDVGSAVVSDLRSFQQQVFASNIAASNDGRVWIESTPINSSINPRNVIFKSPSNALDTNWAGPFQSFLYHNQDWDTFFIGSGEISQPIRGYNNLARTIFYDNKRQALYSCVAALNPDYNTQDCQIYLQISRNNGLSWSTPIFVSSTKAGNRGWQSISLDEATGDLYFSWYGGEGDPTFQSVNFEATVIPACTLDELVEDVTESNPTFITPTATTPLVLANNKGRYQAKSAAEEQRLEFLKDLMKNRKPSPDE